MAGEGGHGLPCFPGTGLDGGGECTCSVGGERSPLSGCALHGSGVMVNELGSSGGSFSVHASRSATEQPVSARAIRQVPGSEHVCGSQLGKRKKRVRAGSSWTSMFKRPRVGNAADRVGGGERLCF
jgi:hypothetical protein